MRLSVEHREHHQQRVFLRNDNPLFICIYIDVCIYIYIYIIYIHIYIRIHIYTYGLEEQCMQLMPSLAASELGLRNWFEIDRFSCAKKACHVLPSIQYHTMISHTHTRGPN